MDRGLIVKKALFLFTVTIFSSQIHGDAAKYLFLQQYNDMCIIAPMVNLLRLEQLETKYPSPDGSLDLKSIPAAEWLTRRQWFGEGYKYLYAWHKAFTWPLPLEVSDTEPKKAPALHAFLTNAIQNGPVTPHFYNSIGKIPFNLSESLRFLFLPFFLVDVDALQGNLKIDSNPIIQKMLSRVQPALGLNAPFIQDQDGFYYAYNQKTKEFEAVAVEKLPLIHHGETIEIYAIPTSELKTSSGEPLASPDFFDTQKELTMLKSTNPKKTLGLGFTGMGFNQSVAQGFMIEDFNIYPESKTDPLSTEPHITRYQPFAPYGLGFYKLMLLRLGFDNNHNKISLDSGESKSEAIDNLSDIYHDLLTLVNSDPNNPWNDHYFSEEKFFPHHLIQLLKDDQQLFQKASQVASLYKVQTWSMYNQFLSEVRAGRWFRDPAGRVPYRYEEVIKYLPGPEQMLAYSILLIVRSLWYGAMGKKAFYEGTLPQIPFFWSLDSFIKAAYKKTNFEGEEVSFISVWQELIDKLKTTGLFEKRKNFVSFEGHGWIISFDQHLIDLDIEILLKRKISDIKSFFLRINQETDQAIQILQDLHCTGIDSYKSQSISSFYSIKS